jgi:UDP-N-acetylglucosamine:LPS N-acetylglucosamine transferase
MTPLVSLTWLASLAILPAMAGFSTKVAFFCRGRGRGHAIPDIEIAGELRRLRPRFELQFVSYGVGAATLRSAGLPVIDLPLNDNSRPLESAIRSLQALNACEPDFVVSHEEFLVLPMAKALGLPTALVVDFFPPVEIWAESLQYADQILFIEHQGMFPEPTVARGRVKYLGPVVRQMRRDGRERARAALGMTGAAMVISVIPGAYATESKAPLLDLVIDAFRGLPHATKRLVWIAGADVEAIASAVADQADVIVRSEYSPIEDLMTASDLVITKANRGTTIEASSLGVPSISISYWLNPIDEVVIPRICSNTALTAKGIDAAYLAATIVERVASHATTPTPPNPRYRAGGAASVAASLVEAIDARANVGDHS